MASTNGVLSPPPPQSDLNHTSISPSTKRKRDDSIDQLDLTNGITNESKVAITNEPPTEDTQALVKDLIDVLKSHDPSPSILTRPLPERSSSVEPQAKRQKPDGAVDSPSILSRSSSNEYTTIDDVLKDIDTAASDIIERLQLSNGANRNQYIPVPTNQSELSMKILAFKKKAHELVRREKASTERRLNATSGQTLNAGSYLSNRNVGSINNAPAEDSKVVLTLYGNATPHNKHLFSSLQIPANVDGETIVQTLREAGLPNGITTTRIVPMQPAVVDDRRRPQTMGEVFPTPANILPLKPPKPTRTSLHPQLEGWIQPSIAEIAARSPDYSKQIITTGQWLDYSNTSSLVSEKKRDKVTSVNGKIEAPESASTEMDAAKLDALFRSAYSGFAPTKDDSKAIAPEGLMNKLWWQRVGERRFENFVEAARDIDNPSLDKISADKILPLGDAEIEEIEQSIKEWGNESIDPNLMASESDKAVQDKDVEEVLEGISELLETLDSYQRNRHMSLNTTGRTIGLHAGSETFSMGTPSKPSESEVATYEMIKSQLVLMIAMLPPYAVAKLNSDQLAELSISTKIEIPMADYKGVMEEDEMATRARVAAMSAASTTRPTTSSSLHRSASSTALYGNQYSTSRPAASTGHQYYSGATQTPIRPPPSNLQRPPATAPVPVAYPPQRAPSATAYRPAMGTSYQSRTPGPTMPQYSQTNGQQYHQHQTPTSSSYARPQSQSYQTVPQATPQATMNRYPSQPPYSAQAQPAQNGANYSYGGHGVAVGRQGSPQKPAYTPQTHVPPPQARQPFSTPTPPIPDRRYMQGPLAQPVMNGSSHSQSPQPQQAPALQAPHQQPLGPTNYSTFMTTEQQTSMMERQRAQLAQQQGTQHQARNAAQPGAMGSPQPPQINANSAVAAGS